VKTSRALFVYLIGCLNFKNKCSNLSFEKKEKVVAIKKYQYLSQKE